MRSLVIALTVRGSIRYRKMSQSVSTVVAALLALALAGEVSAQSLPSRGPGPVRAETDAGLDGATVDEDATTSERPMNFGRVPWVLVVEAVRTAKGDLLPWDGDGEWARLWRVPGDASGTRFVPLDGDAEDRERVRVDAKTKALPSGLDFVAGKYRAPAIALVVREPSGVAVMPWRGGYGSWLRASLQQGAPAEDAKVEALKLIARAFPAGEKRDDAAVVAAKVQARVLAFREADGGIQYQVVVRGRIAQQQLLKLIDKVGGLAVAEIVTTADGYDVVLSDPSGVREPIERRLSRAGLPTEPGGQQALGAPVTAPTD